MLFSHKKCGSHFILAIVLAGCLAAPSILSADNKAADDGNEVLIAYTAPFHRVVLTRNFHITNTEEISEYANPVSALPSRTVKVEKSTLADVVDVMELLLFIRETGFDTLKEVYGGDPKERGYPYTIFIQDRGESKKVVYHSRPDAAPRPEAFSKVENRIIEFANKATEIKTGEVQ